MRPGELGSRAMRAEGRENRKREKKEGREKEVIQEHMGTERERGGKKTES